jgi:hypothetical protein
MPDRRVFQGTGALMMRLSQPEAGKQRAPVSNITASTGVMSQPVQYGNKISREMYEHIVLE